MVIPDASPEGLAGPSGAPLVLAHRGARRAAPENTLAAFAEARRLGAHGVELDVRRSADKVLVVHHDPVVAGAGLVAELSYAELRRARPDLVTLGVALDACRGLLVDIEVKHLPGEPDFDREHGPAVAVAAFLLSRARDQRAADAVVVTSFDDAAVAQVRAFAPALRTGLLGVTADAAGEMARAVAVGASWYLPRVASLPSDVDALKAIVMAARGRGLDVVPWTVNDEAVLEALGHAAVRGVVTDVPEIAGRVLGRR